MELWLMLAFPSPPDKSITMTSLVPLNLTEEFLRIIYLTLALRRFSELLFEMIPGFIMSLELTGRID